MMNRRPWTGVQGSLESPGSTPRNCEVGDPERDVHNRWSMSVLRRVVSGLTIAVSLLGCDAEGSDEAPLVDTRSADPVVASRTSSTLTGSDGLVRLGQAFRATGGAVKLAPEIVAGIQFNIVVAALEQWYERTLGCSPDGLLTTDGLRLDATFDETCDGFVRPSGRFSAEVEVEQGECEDDDGMCAVAIVWTLVTDDLELASPLRAFNPEYNGTLSLRSPLDENERMTWRTGSDFSMAFGIGTLAYESEASWLYDRDTDCLDANFSGRVQLVDLDPSLDDLDARIGEIVLEVDGYRRCGDACPERGDVNLLYGFGEVLRWVYDGGEEARVTGPRGRSFDAPLPCAM